LGKKLHIISFDIPYPADYGGVIDVFYKIKALYNEGVEIVLHCFQYGNRQPDSELNKYCKEVIYYPRITGLRGLHPSLPYIISSRRNNDLLKNLLKDDAPILFEGLHTCYFAHHKSIEKRIKILRAHNIESDYYAGLAMNSQSAFKQLYYSFESNRLRMFERSLNVFDHILSISENDQQFFEKRYGSSKAILVPAFHSNQEVQSLIGSGNYCLYHGNLSVDENIKSVDYLVKSIFSELEIPLIIAGKNPTQAILSYQSKNIQIKANPSDEELNTFIQNAHIHVLPSFQQTGIKLKLLNSLFRGRHIIVNHEIEESHLKDLIHIANSNNLFIKTIKDLMMKDFSEDDLDQRKQALAFYSNEYHANAICDLI